MTAWREVVILRANKKRKKVVAVREREVQRWKVWDGSLR
jgi:hypothetical protein